MCFGEPVFTPTVHGLSSSERSWTADTGLLVAEICLAHVPPSRVVRAYQRSDLVERHADILQAWCDYVARR